MTTAIPPHTSCKYGVVLSNALRSKSEGYSIVAIHALIPTGKIDMMMDSEQRPLGDGDTHAYMPPRYIENKVLVAMCQTTEAAWKVKRRIEQQDKEADGA